MVKCCSKCKIVFVLLLINKSGPKAFVIVFRQPQKKFVDKMLLLLIPVLYKGFIGLGVKNFQIKTNGKNKVRYLEINKLYFFWLAINLSNSF